MNRPILPGLRTTLLLHVIVAAIFGLALILVPDTFAATFGIKISEPLFYRVVGAAVLSFGASSWWAWHETDYSSVKIVVEMEMVWTALSTILYLYGTTFGGYPLTMGISAIIMLAFFLAFGYYYMKEGATAMTPVRR